jgi:hypothetical protein
MAGQIKTCMPGIKKLCVKKESPAKKPKVKKNIPAYKSLYIRLPYRKYF